MLGHGMEIPSQEFTKLIGQVIRGEDDTQGKLPTLKILSDWCVSEAMQDHVARELIAVVQEFATKNALDTITSKGISSDSQESRRRRQMAICQFIRGIAYEALYYQEVGFSYQDRTILPAESVNFQFARHFFYKSSSLQLGEAVPSDQLDTFARQHYVHLTSQLYDSLGEDSEVVVGMKDIIEELESIARHCSDLDFDFSLRLILTQSKLTSLTDQERAIYLLSVQEAYRRTPFQEVMTRCCLQVAERMLDQFSSFGQPSVSLKYALFRLKRLSLSDPACASELVKWEPHECSTARAMIRLDPTLVGDADGATNLQLTITRLQAQRVHHLEVSTPKSQTPSTAAVTPFAHHHVKRALFVSPSDGISVKV